MLLSVTSMISVTPLPHQLNLWSLPKLQAWLNFHVCELLVDIVDRRLCFHLIVEMSESSEGQF